MTNPIFRLLLINPGPCYCLGVIVIEHVLFSSSITCHGGVGVLETRHGLEHELLMVPGSIPGEWPSHFYPQPLLCTCRSPGASLSLLFIFNISLRSKTRKDLLIFSPDCVKNHFSAVFLTIQLKQGACISFLCSMLLIRDFFTLQTKFKVCSEPWTPVPFDSTSLLKTFDRLCKC